MNILKLLFITVVILFITSCSNENIVNEISVIKENTYKELSVQHGMLVFPTVESFDETIEKVNKMGDAEKRTWEENLGFKSFDRLVSEIQDVQIKYQEKFAYLTKEELENALGRGEIDRYSPQMQEYVNKGVFEMVVDENKAEYLEINSPLYSALVNVDGFVAVGNEILQYSKNKFKIIKSLDFSKIEELQTIKDNINNDNFFVTDIHKREKLAMGELFNYSAESFTNNREKIRATEIYEYYDRYHDNVHYEAIYSLKIRNMQKGWWWHTDSETRTWIWGNFDIEAMDMPTGKENLSYNYPDMKISYKKITVLKRWFYKSDYLNTTKGGPQILSSTWNFQRWGGAHGLGVRLIDHTRYERF